MITRQRYEIWGVGSSVVPPAVLQNAIDGEERLLWAAMVPSSAFNARLIGVSVLFAVLMAGFLFAAPWGQSMDEFCAPDHSRSCQKFYVALWPGVIGSAYLTALGPYQEWRSKTAPWTVYFGVTTNRAVRIIGKEPKKIHDCSLDRTTAKRTFFGDVKFGRSKTALRFACLNDKDADRAVYWANQGRLMPEFANGSPP